MHTRETNEEDEPVIEIDGERYWSSTAASRYLGLDYGMFGVMLERYNIERIRKPGKSKALLLRAEDVASLRKRLTHLDDLQDIESDAGPVLGIAEAQSSSSNVRAFPNIQTADVSSLVAALHTEVDRINWTEDRVRSFMAIISAMRSYDVLELYRTQTG